MRDAAFSAQLDAHINRLAADLRVAVQASLVLKGGKPYFLPPFAATGFKPYDSMVQKSRGHEPGNGCPDFAPTNVRPVLQLGVLQL